jgi:DNA-binding NtrC family response regulator
MNQKKINITMSKIYKYELLGESRQIQALLLEIKKVSRVDAPVMINGKVEPAKN